MKNWIKNDVSIVFSTVQTKTNYTCIAEPVLAGRGTERICPHKKPCLFENMRFSNYVKYHLGRLRLNGFVRRHRSAFLHFVPLTSGLQAGGRLCTRKPGSHTSLVLLCNGSHAQALLSAFLINGVYYLSLSPAPTTPVPVLCQIIRI